MGGSTQFNSYDSLPSNVDDLDYNFNPMSVSGWWIFLFFYENFLLLDELFLIWALMIGLII